ncbi:MAG: hypothetical protein WKF54_12390 [Nocardioidaceae bacterium]
MQRATDEPTFATGRVIRLASLVEELGSPAAVTGRPAILAIDGRSSSGKTTLARRIEAMSLTCSAVHTDDIAWNHSRFGWADLLTEHVLAPARRGRPVSFLPPGWESHGRQGRIEVPSGCDLLVVEGVGAGRQELRPMVDAVIWVETALETAEARDLARVGTPGGARSMQNMRDWLAEERPFLGAERTWEWADAIVAGATDVAHDPTRDVVTLVISDHGGG